MFIHNLKFKKILKKYFFVLSSFLIWKATVSVLGILLIQLIDYQPTFPYFESLKSKYDFLFLYIWGGFDGVHYLDIAQDGYTKQYTQAFFPLYPMLINILSFGIVPKLIIGVLINNIGLLFGLIFLQKIIQEKFKKINYRFVILLFLSYPFSFFFNGVYNEGLFLAVTLICFYAYFHQKTILTILMGIFATSTRLAGIYLIPAIGLFVLFDQNRKKIRMIAPLSLISFGLIAYMIFLEVKFGNFLYFIQAQNYFGNSRSSDLVFFPQVIYRYIKILLSVPITSHSFIIAVTEFIVTNIFLILPIIFYKKIPYGFIAFSLVVVIVPSLTGTFGSIPRYVLMSFPVFILLGMLKKRYKIILIGIFTLLQIYFLSIFISGRFVA